MFQSPPSVDDIAHIIQVALTPVFLLSGIASLLAVFATRLGRVADKVDALSDALDTASKAESEQILARLGYLRRRSHALDAAVVLGALAGVSTSAAALMLFVGTLRNGTGSTLMFLAFGAALVLTIGALTAFLTEMLMASRGIRAIVAAEQQDEVEPHAEPEAAAHSASAAPNVQDSAGSVVQSIRSRLRPSFSSRGVSTPPHRNAGTAHSLIRGTYGGRNSFKPVGWSFGDAVSDVVVPTTETVPKDLPSPPRDEFFLPENPNSTFLGILVVFADSDSRLRCSGCHFADFSGAYSEVSTSACHALHVATAYSAGYFRDAAHHRRVFRDHWNRGRCRQTGGGLDSRGARRASANSGENQVYQRSGDESAFVFASVGPTKPPTSQLNSEVQNMGLAQSLFRGTQHAASELFETILVLFFL